MNWKLLMSLFNQTPTQAETVAKLESIEVLRALDEVGCVEVSDEVARELGAFDETAISLNDVLDDEEQ